MNKLLNVIDLVLARQSLFRGIRKKAFKNYSRNNSSSTFRIKTAPGFKMEIKGADVVANNIIIYKIFEPGVTKLIQEISKSSATAIDIGCNIGYFSCLIKHVNPEVKLICVDPNREVLDACRNNLMINGYSAEYFECAIGDKPGTQQFLCPVDHPSLGTLGSSVKVKGDVREIKVRVDTFDNILKESKVDKIDLLKMDTEGYDLKILSSINEHTALNIRNIIMEYNQLRLGQCQSSQSDLFRIPWVSNFKKYAVLESGDLKEINNLEEWPASESETLLMKRF